MHRNSPEGGIDCIFGFRRQLRRTVLNNNCWRSRIIIEGTLVGWIKGILDTRAPCRNPSKLSKKYRCLWSGSFCKAIEDRSLKMKFSLNKIDLHKFQRICFSYQMGKLTTTDCHLVAECPSVSADFRRFPLPDWPIRRERIGTSLVSNTNSIPKNKIWF